jgi:hypothetical protein
MTVLLWDGQQRSSRLGGWRETEEGKLDTNEAEEDEKEEERSPGGMRRGNSIKQP